MCLDAGKVTLGHETFTLDLGKCGFNGLDHSGIVLNLHIFDQNTSGFELKTNWQGLCPGMRITDECSYDKPVHIEA